MLFETFTRAPEFSTNDAPCSSSNSTQILLESLLRLQAKQLASAKVLAPQEPNLRETNETGKLKISLEDAFERYRQVLEKLENQDQDSFMVHACMSSLKTRVPRMLQLATLLLKSFYEADSKPQLMIARLRSFFQIERVQDYLTVIEKAFQDPPRGSMDISIGRLLSSPPMLALSEEFDLRSATRVSLWSRSSLNLEIPAGMARHRECEASKTTMPVSVHVEPFFVFSAEALLNGIENPENLSVCHVTFEECKHTSLDFSRGAGKLGKCIVKVRLDPIECSSSDDSVLSSLPRRIVVDEARVIQRNAYPPKPRASVDVYVSTYEEELGITVTMIIDTYTTRDNEEPRLHVDLCLAH